MLIGWPPVAALRHNMSYMPSLSHRDIEDYDITTYEYHISHIHTRHISTGRQAWRRNGSALRGKRNTRIAAGLFTLLHAAYCWRLAETWRYATGCCYYYAGWR